MITWPTKKLGAYVLVIVLGTAAVVSIFGFPEYLNQLNLLILTITLIVLIWYAYDTHRIADQSVEANLRPVILRSGWIPKWEDVKFSIKHGQLEGQPLQFTILKNISKDISGYIVLNNKKYKLLFANEISQVNDKDPSVVISDLEKKVMLYLYEIYKRTKSNSRWKILDAYRELGIKDGNYLGVLNNSKYIKTTGEEFQLTDEGIRLMDTEKIKAFEFLPKWGWMMANTTIYAIYTDTGLENIKAENGITLFYKDIEGNKYYTKENQFFSQSSGKL